MTSCNCPILFQITYKLCITVSSVFAVCVCWTFLRSSWTNHPLELTSTAVTPSRIEDMYCFQWNILCFLILSFQRTSFKKTRWQNITAVCQSAAASDYETFIWQQHFAIFTDILRCLSCVFAFFSKANI